MKQKMLNEKAKSPESIILIILPDITVTFITIEVS